MPSPCCQGAAHFNPRSPHGERRLHAQHAKHRGDFNPRSPHGERQCLGNCVSRGDAFQSTLPARGATWRLSHCHSNTKTFQSTLPARGATLPLITLYIQFVYFNPRSPHGERHATCKTRRLLAPFQSTLPARGATDKFRVVAQKNLHFNPRSPHGERRVNATNGVKKSLEISIHAPRTGSDRAK